MLLRLSSQTHRHILLRRLVSSTPHKQPLPHKSPSPYPTKLPTLQKQPYAPPFKKRTSLILLLTSATLLTSAALLSDPNSEPDPRSVINQTLDKSNASLKRVLNHVKQTGVAATVLWQSLWSVLSNANHEVRAGFELRVAGLLADIVAANATRRAAIVRAGGGRVVDWLIETVARDGCGTQAEAARALAYLVADREVSGDVLGRVNAVPCLLRFIFSCQPKSKKHARRSSFDVSDTLKGRSMLVAAIMDIVTSNCESLDKISFQPALPGNAQLRDIAAAIHVIEEGGMHLDDPQENEGDEDGGNGMKGLGIKILEGTTVLGFARHTGHLDSEQSDATHMKYVRETPKTVFLQNKYDTSPEQENLSSAVVPGLWDDLHCQHVAVPFAAWALANWALSSEENRSHIQELDQDGCAVMSALSAPERSVKWHGSLVARLLLEDRNLPLNDSVSDWTSSLLSTISHASKSDDISLAHVALSAFILSVERCPVAQKVVMEKGLHQMRDIAKRTRGHKDVQEALAKALELLCSGDMQLSLEESHKWSGILLPWVFGKNSSDHIRTSATKILSHILEDYGPLSVPISQGWLTIILSEILSTSNKTTFKGGNPAKGSNVKTQVDQSIILSAAQTANQLAIAVVNTAGKQLASAAESVESSPLADLLSLDPFSGPSKNLKKDNLPKFHAADSAVATLKGIKALTEVCIGDLLCQEKLADFGVLCLLRRLLLCDDYEKLAAFEAYDASRAVEAQEWAKNNTEESYNVDHADSSSVRVPPTAHIRRHAARLLTVLSLLPKVQKEIFRDEVWCRWLEDCANGKIQGCSDVKIQSYARATLLHVLCNEQSRKESMKNVDPDNASENSKKGCPRYDDMIFLINPELPHWKCLGNLDNQDTNQTDVSPDSEANIATGASDDGSPLNRNSSEIPPIDIVFVHGLRGGPYKTWRISEDKSSTKSGLVEKIDQEAGKQGTFWPGEWLSNDFPQARLFTLRYKTNLTQWSGATLPLQEVSSMILEKLVAAGIGDRPVVFVTHSMGGLVVKEMLYRAKDKNMESLVNNTIGIVFYSCPHFGSKLADMPWRMGLVLRPAPTIGELRSGSSRLVELNDFVRHRHKKGMLDVLSFCETKVTPIVEGYGGWAFRMEIVPIESAYPGFGELVVLDATDHINSCKPLSRTDPSYTEILEFLHKLKSQYK